MATSIPLAFTVRRSKPELVAPFKPTPHERKPLSDIDDQKALRFQVPAVQFYKYDPSMQGKDPTEVIKEALAKTLVTYYPFAGRLREIANGKLIVDCTGEGVLFIKADADITLEQFGDTLQPPFPCFHEFLYDVPGSGGLLNCPLLLIQVTRLKCGGFIFATRFNHVMCDGTGLKQFMSAMGEMARGIVTCSISPAWERHLLDAGDPQQVTFSHYEYNEVEHNTMWPLDNLIQRSFFFGPVELSSIRNLLPLHLRHCTRFELLTAFLWRCRTVALNLDPDEKVRMICVVNLRPRFICSLPPGYYGNAFVFPAAITTARDLLDNPLGYAVELVKQVKASATEEYTKSVAALMVIRGKQLPYASMTGSFALSDLTSMGFEDVDYGWGNAVYGGPATADGVLSYIIPTKNKKGEVGALVPIYLPALAMKIFEKELDMVLKYRPIQGKEESKRSAISSAL